MALRALWEPKKTGIAFFDQNMTVAFGVNNVFNRKYIGAGNILEVSPTGAARNFYLQVEKRFWFIYLNSNDRTLANMARKVRSFFDVFF